MKQHIISNHTVPRETFKTVDQITSKYEDILEKYLDKLLWWNDRINLVSRSVSRETVWEHICHSLIISQFDAFIDSHLVVDTGTGGGLPGIPLAITHPKKHFVLNDLVTKKCMAMKQISKQLDLENIGIIDGSIEELQLDEEFLLISKHAFKINEIIALTSHLPWKKMLLYKGIDFEDELEGISETLDIKRHDLSMGPRFYNGKAILEITLL